VSTVSSGLDRQARMYKEQYEEVHSLYLINKSALKTNLGDLVGSPHGQVVEALTKENAKLYEMITELFTHRLRGAIEGVPGPVLGSQKKEGGGAEAKIGSWIAEVRGLEAENRALRQALAQREGTGTLWGGLGVPSGELGRLKAEKSWQDRVRTLETRLVAVTRFKNALIRDRFVG